MPLLVALYARPRLHRLVPAPVLFGALRLRARLLPRGSSDDAMTFLLAGCSRAGEIPRLSPKFSFEMSKRRELLWRPDLQTHLPVEDRELLHQAIDTGRGVILSFMHHGPYAGLFSSLARQGFELAVVVADFVADSLSQPPRAESRRAWIEQLRTREHARVVAMGASLMRASESRYALRERLRSGGVVAVAWDTHSKHLTPATLLGRGVLAASGISRVSKETGCIVVPLHMRPRGNAATIVVGLPLSPDDYADSGEMHAALVHRHEPYLLAWPEALEWPRERWLLAPEGT